MILTTVLSLAVMGQGPLPGSKLTLEQAKQEAGFIVVAEVGKTGDRLVLPEMSFLMWTELKPSAVLKGEVTGEELNRHPLAIRALGIERLPKTGDELVFFIRDGSDDFSIAKILPKTEEALTAIKAAMPPTRVDTEKGRLDQKLNPVGGDGLGGGGLGGGMPILKPTFLKPAPPPPYRGTKIVPDPKAEGDMLKLQNEFAAAMSRSNPGPEGRRAHFDWLDKNECVRRYRVLRIGWYGGVTGCEPRPGGGWLVKVVIRPWLHSMGIRHNYVLDTVEETYEFVGGGIRLLASDAAEAKPALQHFPVAY